MELKKSERIYSVSNMKYSKLSKIRLSAIGRSQSIFRSFIKGQSTKAKNSPISLTRGYMGRLSLLANKDHDTAGKLAGASAETLNLARGMKGSVY